MLSLAQTSESWYAAEYLSNHVWQWAVLLGVLIATFVIGKVVSFFLNRQGQWLSQRERFGAVGLVLSALSAPAALLIFAGGLFVGGLFMNLKIPKLPGLEGFWAAVCKTIAVLAVGWALYRLVTVLERFLRRWAAKTETALDDQLVPLVRKSLRVVIVIIVLLVIAQGIFNWNIGALLAGLGLGGLAFALAAQDTLKNLFGSLTIFADRPFTAGDWVNIDGHVGIVEDVGFRSTRVRTFDGHLVSIPNAIVTSSPVENVARRPFIRRVLNVTVTYDTPPEKVARAVEILKDMLAARKDHFPPERPGNVYFNDFNAASLNIVVYYWFTPPDWWEYLGFAHDFNMELLERFNAEGIEFAFPTQTLYLKQDSPLAADVRLRGGSGKPMPE